MESIRNSISYLPIKTINLHQMHMCYALASLFPNLISIYLSVEYLNVVSYTSHANINNIAILTQQSDYCTSYSP